MTLIKYLFFILLFFYFYLYCWSLLYVNPYKLLLFIGRKGSGKSTISVKIAQKFIQKGWTVFSDSPIFDCYKLDINWLGRNDFPEKSLIIVDEGAIAFDNRKYSSFSDEMRNFFTMQRHKMVYVIILSQAFNVDKKIRDLTDGIYIVVNYFNIISIAKKVHKGIGLSQDSDGCGSIGETYSWELPFSWQFTFIPRWIHFFDSFISEPLPKVRMVKHSFGNYEEIVKYRSWKHYKLNQLKWCLEQVLDNLPMLFFINSEKQRHIFKLSCLPLSEYGYIRQCNFS